PPPARPTLAGHGRTGAATGHPHVSRTNPERPASAPAARPAHRATPAARSPGRRAFRPAWHNASVICAPRWAASGRAVVQPGAAARRSVGRHARGAHALHSARRFPDARSEEHTSELQSRENLVCRLLLEKKKE